MQRLLVKIMLPIIMAGSLFACLNFYRDGWNAVSYDGADPWSVIFLTLGNLTVPLLLAVLAAGLAKLLKRDANLWNVWLIAFGSAVPIFAVLYLVTASHGQSHAPDADSDQMRDCPIIADFSSEATTVEIDVEKQYIGKAWRRIDIYETGFSSLDCYLVSPDEMLPGMSQVDVLLAWAEQEGLEQEGVYAVDPPYPHSKMISSRFTDGREVVFEHRIFLFPDSIVLASTSADRRDYPTLQNERFVASLDLKADQE